MGKIIMFPLSMPRPDGYKVNNLEEFKAHFDLDSVVFYFHDGRLLRWLKARNYTESAQVEKLSHEDENLAQKLCEIFGVKSNPKPKTLPAELVEILNRLNQITNNKEVLEKFTEEFLSKVAHVAFEQAELNERIKSFGKIYLVSSTFDIPLDRTDKTYVGIGDKVTVIIKSDKTVDFDSLNIKLKKIHIEGDNWICSSDELAEFEQLINSGTAKSQYMEKMRQLKKKLISTKNAKALRMLGDLYKKIPEFIMAEDCYREANLIDNPPAQKTEPKTNDTSVSEDVEILTVFKEIKKSISLAYTPIEKMVRLQQELEDAKDVTNLRELAVIYDEVKLLTRAKDCRTKADQIELACLENNYRIKTDYTETSDGKGTPRKKKKTSPASPEGIIQKIEQLLSEPYNGTYHIKKAIRQLINIAQERHSSKFMQRASEYYQRIHEYDKAKECNKKAEEFKCSNANRSTRKK